MSITSEELNYLIWRYLQETGNELTALALQEETRVLEFESLYGKHVPVGTLVNLVQRGILYTESELLLESCEFAKVKDMKPVFSENFNLVDALRVDKEKYPEIKQTGRFTLRRTGEESDNKTTSAQDTNFKLPLPMVLVYRFMTLNNNNNNSSSSSSTDKSGNKTSFDNDFAVLNSQWNPRIPTLLYISGSNSISRIYRIKGQDEENGRLKCELLAKLKHPLAHSSIDSIDIDIDTNVSVSVSANIDGNGTAITTTTTTPATATNEITAIAWSHDGNLLITAVENGEIRLWNKSGTLKNVFSLHEHPIVTLSWNSDSSYFVSLDVLNNAILWNATTGTVVRHYSLSRDLKRTRTRGDHHNHYQNGSSGGVGGGYQHSERQSSRSRERLHNASESFSASSTNGSIFGVAVEWIDRNKFVLPGGNGDLIVYQIDEDEFLGRLSGHQGAIGCLEYNCSNRMLVSAADDFTIRVWYGGNTNAVCCLYGHSQTIVCVNWVTSKTLVSSSMDGTVRVWSVGSGNTRLVGIKLLDGIPIFSAELSHDRRRYCVGLMNGQVYMLDLRAVIAGDEKPTVSYDVNTPMEIPVLAEFERRRNHMDTESQGGQGGDQESKSTKEMDMEKTKEERVSVYSVSWSSDDRRVSVVYSNGACNLLELPAPLFSNAGNSVKKE